MSQPIQTTPNTTAYLAMSLDGYIARADHGLDWLDGWGQPEESPQDYGYAQIMSEVDAMVMGRGTFDVISGFDGWHYALPVYVLTNRALHLSDTLQASIEQTPNARVEAISGSAQSVLKQLAERGHEHLYVDGGKTIQSFLAAKQLERLIITTIPILLGEGVPLFGQLDGDVRLRLDGSQAFSTGFVQSTYTVLR